MNETYSQIDIFEKGEDQNALPLTIWFLSDLINSSETYTNETVCEFINNNALSL